MIFRIFIIVLVAAILGGINNFINPNKVPWVGNWPNSLSDSDTTWTSPSYEKGDPPTLRLSEAFDRWASKSYVFIDAREPDEYKTGHIEGAISLSFDYLDDFKDKVLPTIPKDTLIVTYCSGSECDASLLLARALVQQYGYKHVEIFFGGWAQWSKQKLPIEGSYGDEAETH